MLAHLSAKQEHKLHHEDYVMEMPQPAERIQSREKMREFQEKLTLRRRLFTCGEYWSGTAVGRREDQ